MIPAVEMPCGTSSAVAHMPMRDFGALRSIPEIGQESSFSMLIQRGGSTAVPTIWPGKKPLVLMPEDSFQVTFGSKTPKDSPQKHFP